ncbi:hypothetical protein RSAG8_04312, partial [Rhizoctonia solani AG-8 WAC10335]
MNFIISANKGRGDFVFFPSPEPHATNFRTPNCPSVIDTRLRQQDLVATFS